MKQKTATDTALGFAGAVLAVGWIVSMVWTQRQPDWVRAGVTLFFLIAITAAGATAQARADGRLDEVELAAARFGSRWGLVAGMAFMNMLIVLPPFHLLLEDFAAVLDRFSGFPRAVEGRMFLVGVVTTFVAQEAFRVLLAAGWKWSKR